MCGIAGVFYSNSLEDSQDIQLMADAIAHRGPDGEGFLAVSTQSGKITELGGKKTPLRFPSITDFGANANMYLAHRRLSIIDLSSAGHQPMSNKHKDNWVTYNGEIYNYKSLRSEFSGYNFTSNTDTEVVLCAYEKLGVDCLHRLNGMWSFVIYDKKKNILFGSRDRFGVKPLYYAETADFFAFNSEIKGLTAIPKMSRKLNINASAAFLHSGQLSFEGETFFDSITELQPAHYFIYDLGKHKLSIEKYYELPFCDTWENFNERKCLEYIDEVKERVLNSVKLRLNADVTVGSCLSGGIDSSSIVCSINTLLKNMAFPSIGPKQGVVTACYNDSPIDESKWAKYVVDHVFAEWHKIYPKKEELEKDLSDLIFTQDVPFGSTSIYAQYRVMKAAKEAGISVMLDGQGGDELFTGYTSFYNVLYSEAKKNNDYDLLKNEQFYIDNTPLREDIITPLMQNIVTKLDLKYYAKKYLPKRLIKLIKNILSKPDSMLWRNYIKISEKPYRYHTYNTLNQMMYTQMSHVSLPTLLKYEDRNSMRFSIESRTPFADDIDLIEYVFSIPGVYKIHNGWSKYLLRESMSGIVPEQIKKRTDKIGFETPEYDWLQSIKPFIFQDYNTSLNEILDMKHLSNNWDELFAKQNRRGITDIWRCINFILWFNIFNVTI